MLLLFLACAPSDDSGIDYACEAYPPPRFTIHVVDVDGNPATADRAWAEDADGNVYEGACDDDACTTWSGIADDGPVTLYAEAGGLTSEGVEDVIVRDDENCTVDEAEGTVVVPTA